MSLLEATYTEEIYSIRPPFTVVLDVPFAELKEDERVLMGKILGAIGQSESSVRILTESPVNMSRWPGKPDVVLAFQRPPAGLPLYEPTPTGITTIVFSDTLTTLLTDTAAKQKLWGALKQLRPA